MLFKPQILGLYLTSLCFWHPTVAPLANASKSLQNILRTWPCLPKVTVMTCRGYCNDSLTGLVGSTTACLLQCVCNSIARLILSKDSLDPCSSIRYPPVSPPLRVNTDALTLAHGLTCMASPTSIRPPTFLLAYSAKPRDPPWSSSNPPSTIPLGWLCTGSFHSGECFPPRYFQDLFSLFWSELKRDFIRATFLEHSI